MPHCNQPIPVVKVGQSLLEVLTYCSFQRINPTQLSKHEISKLKKELFTEYKALVESLKHQGLRISRWLIADGLFTFFNEDILKNMVMTRLEFPNLPE